MLSDLPRFGQNTGRATLACRTAAAPGDSWSKSSGSAIALRRSAAFPFGAACACGATVLRDATALLATIGADSRSATAAAFDPAWFASSAATASTRSATESDAEATDGWKDPSDGDASGDAVDRKSVV